MLSIMQSKKLEKHPISTPSRFLFLNFYAFFLLTLGGGVIAISFIFGNTYLKCGLITAGAYSLYGSLKIFSSWSDKKRKYNILVQRNSPVFRPDTFTEFMSAPCGRLLARVVINDLGMKSRWYELKTKRQPISHNRNRVILHKL